MLAVWPAFDPIMQITFVDFAEWETNFWLWDFLRSILTSLSYYLFTFKFNHQLHVLDLNIRNKKCVKRDQQSVKHKRTQQTSNLRLVCPRDDMDLVSSLRMRLEYLITPCGFFVVSLELTQSRGSRCVRDAGICNRMRNIVSFTFVLRYKMLIWNAFTNLSLSRSSAITVC